MQHTYFAADGNYGDATDLVIIDTTDWDESDWEQIDMARDTDRARIALEISRNDPDQQELPL